MSRQPADRSAGNVTPWYAAVALVVVAAVTIVGALLDAAGRFGPPIHQVSRLGLGFDLLLALGGVHMLAVAAVLAWMAARWAQAERHTATRSGDAPAGGR